MLTVRTMPQFPSRGDKGDETPEPESTAPKKFKAHPDWKDVTIPLIPIASWRESTKERVLPKDPRFYKLILRVKFFSEEFTMQTSESFLDLGTTIEDIAGAYGPTFGKSSGYPKDMIGSSYNIHLVKVREDSDGVEDNITSRKHEVRPEEWPIRAWNFEPPKSGEIPKTLRAHMEWRRINEGRTVVEPDAEAASDGDYRVEDVEFTDGEDDARAARGGGGGRRDDRDRGGGGFDQDPFTQVDRDRGIDREGRGAPFGGGGGGPFAPRDDRGGPTQQPPRFDPTGWFVWSQPRGTTGEFKRCNKAYDAIWVGDHYEPAPLAATNASGIPASEEPPIVNGLIYNGVAWVPAPHGATKINGRWVPLPDPNAAMNSPITNPARQLPPPPPPRPESHPDDSSYFLIDNQWTHCPGGIRLDAQSGQWVPRPPPPPIVKPAAEANVSPPMSLSEKLALLTSAATAIVGSFGAVTQPRIAAELAAEERRRDAERLAEDRRREETRLAEDRRRESERAAEDRRREEARIAAERAKADADAQKETARLMAEAQKEAAKLAAEAQIKAAELNAERERAAREAEERRRDAHLEREREDRRREEDRKAEERRIETAAALKREELATQARLAAEAAAEAERVRREQRDREERIASEKRMADILAIAKEKPPAPPPAPDFTRELERRRKEAEALGAKFGDAAGGDAASAATATVIGAVAERLTDVAGKYVDATLEARKLEARAAAQAPPPPRQPPPISGFAPPPPGYIWHKFPDNSLGMIPAPVQPTYVPPQHHFAPPPPALTSPPITLPAGIVTPPEATQEPVQPTTHYGEEPAWGVIETPPTMIVPTQPEPAPEPRRTIIDFGDDYAPPKRRAPRAQEHAVTVNEPEPNNVARDNRSKIVETPVVVETPEPNNDAASDPPASADPAAEATIEPAQ